MGSGVEWSGLNFTGAMAILSSVMVPAMAKSPPLSVTGKAAITSCVVLDREYKMRVPYELRQGQSRLFHKLPSGLSMEVISQKGASQRILEDEGENSKPYGSPVPAPPLVFLHGSYHAAWCWAEHWLPYFSQKGHDCYALSFLGQGESDSPASEVKVAGSLQTHAADVADFIREEMTVPPVLLGHSFGALIVQYYISRIRGTIAEMENIHPDLSGAVLICSVPPSGNSGLVLRYIFTKPIAAFKVTLSLAAKAFQTSLSLCKETFFSAEMENSLVQKYQELMRESSKLPLFDLRNLNASLPVPSVPSSSLDILVLGAKNDFIVDMEGLNETSRFYDTTPICIEGVAHDMMLDCSWERGAEAILSWLRSREEKKKNAPPK